MKLHRPILLALLLPLLLDLLVVFTSQSFVPSKETAFCEQEATDVLARCEEAEEQLEEEDEFSPGCTPHADAALLCPVFHGYRLFHSSSAASCPLAYGWRMPLRI